ncbi:MAG TPA: carboxypeptidase-like regulatory domain-containing protein, partial [Gemmatimonadaceae bacterium]|nr:carboxypeptidase-like regulatory domain-containing protein [Gemmatimonadaceae bacterium]
MMGTRCAGSRWAFARCRACTAALATLAACVPVGIAAQVTADISVRVVDRGGQAVVGAHIVVDSGVRIGQSDVDGGLVFRQLALGEHVISATRIGYAPARVPVEVDGNDNHVLIVMLPIARVLDSVRIVERSVGLAWSVVLLDQFRQPVTGAQVGAIGTAETTQTDSAGHGRIVMRKPGSVVIRARKIGYAPVIVSLRLLGPRIDTLLMRRLATSLTPAEVMDRSGFGRDTFVYRDMDARLRWRGAGAGVVTRDELVPLGRMSLCDALPYTPTGTQAGLNP